MIEFKIGQKVWCWNWGWGVVTTLESDDDYPVHVQFSATEDDINDCWYTSGGAEYKGGNRSLYFKEIPIPPEALIPPVEEIVLNVGDIVLFYNGQLRYVSAYSGANSETVDCHDSVPQDLDSAFNYVTSYKKFIRKVIGNING